MKGIPANEEIFVQIIAENKGLYFITAKPLRDVYYIYKIDGSTATRLGKGENPLELERKYVK